MSTEDGAQILAEHLRESATGDEPRGFAPEQMVACVECLRANPPTRGVCLYCGNALEPPSEAAANQRPTLRPMEAREYGFNVIRIPGEQWHSPASITDAAALLRLEVEQLERLLATGAALPVARSPVLEEATLVSRLLADLGFHSRIISDADLAPASPPVRLRALRFTAGALVGMPAGSTGESSILWPEIALIVAGRLFSRAVEIEERLKRAGDNQIIESHEFMSDEAVLDIYGPGYEDRGWRIRASGFDFTCLGTARRLLAAENLRLVAERLRENGPVTFYDDAYPRLRASLDAIWPYEQRSIARGWRRVSGKYNAATAIASGNELQFNRYSRMQARMRAAEHAG